MDNVLPITKSWVNTFLRCPWRAWSEHTMGLAPRGGSATEFGTLAHEVRAAMLTLPNGVFLGADSNRWSDDAVLFVVDALKKHPDPTPRDHQWVEFKIGIDQAGKRVENYELAILVGTMDWVFYDNQDGREILVCEDLKTGAWERDDEFERDAYAVLTAALDPGIAHVVFRRFYARSGNMPSWTYTPVDLEEAFQKILIMIRRIKDADPDPNPGRHCESWYGKPCAFREIACPAFSSALVPVEEITSARELMSGFVADPVSASTDVVQRAVMGLAAMDRFRRTLNAACKKWADQHQPLVLPDGRKWGKRHKTKWDIDVAKTLSIMIQGGLTLDEISKGINISPSSLAKLGVEHRRVLDKIDSEAVYEDGDRWDYGILEDDA